MMGLPYVQTSVFVDSRHPFGGNQLATFWDAKANAVLSPNEMQGIALEMNFSETTFINSPSLENCVAKVRIFTPAKELPFAGHPTLGTAFVVKHKGLVESKVTEAMLELGIGAILIEFVADDVIRMTQSKPQFLKEWDDKRAIAEAINLTLEEISDAYPVQFVSTGFPYLFVPITSLSALQRAQPNATLILNTLEGQPSRNILIFSTEVVNKDSDVHVRMFAPAVGVIEDPATGSAAGPLAAYLEYYNVLARKTKGTRIIIEQGYEIKRPSQLVAEVIGDKEIERVLVSGIVKLVADGTFYLQ